jgi:hypothetical protein
MPELFQQGSGGLEVGGIESFRVPAVGLRKTLTGLVLSIVPLVGAGKTNSRTELPRFAPLSPGNANRLKKMLLGRIRLRHLSQSKFALKAIKRGRRHRHAWAVGHDAEGGAESPGLKPI